MGQGPCPMLLATSSQATLTLPSIETNPDMLKLLTIFYDVSQAPKGLPPTKLQDHMTPLIDEGKVVNIRFYKYPTV